MSIVKELADKYQCSASDVQVDAKDLIELGGKEWTKNNIHRVYLNSDVVISLLKLTKVTDFELKSLKKAKTFFDVKTKKFFSDVGTVRVLFNQHGIKCKNP